MTDKVKILLHILTYIKTTKPRHFTPHPIGLISCSRCIRSLQRKTIEFGFLSPRYRFLPCELSQAIAVLFACPLFIVDRTLGPHLAFFGSAGLPLALALGAGGARLGWAGLGSTRLGWASCDRAQHGPPLVNDICCAFLLNTYTSPRVPSTFVPSHVSLAIFYVTLR